MARPPLRVSRRRLQRGLKRRVEAQRERLRWLIGRAALVSPSARLAERSQRLDDLEQRMFRALRQILADRRSALGERRSRLWQVSPVARVRSTAARQAALYARLRAAALARLHFARERLAPLVRTLNAVSPLATLDRGYAIVSRVSGAIVRSAAELSPGTPIEVRRSPVGKIRAKVEGLCIRRTRCFAAPQLHMPWFCLSALLICASPLLAFSYTLPRENAVPGGSQNHSNSTCMAHPCPMSTSTVTARWSFRTIRVGSPLSASPYPPQARAAVFRSISSTAAVPDKEDPIYDQGQAVCEPVAHGWPKVRSICRRPIWNA